MSSFEWDFDWWEIASLWNKLDRNMKVGKRRHIWWMVEADWCDWDIMYVVLWCQTRLEKGIGVKCERYDWPCERSHFILFCVEDFNFLRRGVTRSHICTCMFYDNNSYTLHRWGWNKELIFTERHSQGLTEVETSKGKRERTPLGIRNYWINDKDSFCYFFIF